MTEEAFNINFEIPQFLIHHYYISGCISVSINSFVFYLLLFHRNKMDSFRYYLMGFQLACSLVDIHLTFLMQPIPLFPLVSGYCRGVLSKLFNVTPHVCMTILAFLVGAQVNSLNLCFLRKHQAIAKISSKHVLNKSTHRAIVFFFLTYTLTYTVPFYLAQYPREYKLQMIDKKYPMYRHQFEMLPNFGYYELNAMILTYVIMIIGGCIQSTLTVSLLAFQMYRALVFCSHNLSKTTLEKHKSALKSLVCQFLTTPIAILPAMLIVSTLFVPFKGAQLFTQYMLAVMTTHSTINCLVMIFTIPEFRAFVMFRSKEGKLQRHRKSVSFVVANSNGSTRPFRISNRRSVF
ncbi:Protein CBG27174 [Caenorhabditis briggsae]|uniref:Protein CBG27174 n=1 Tax=Caenorhabditis briggsae TaxID=6238 RepID=B6IL83_CAEBR|nr:Protein CBG27174 [Caenorhabditis briggsae]CAS00636.1 Protein CBG27174 [Caenorhabditis briggsae]